MAGGFIVPLKNHWIFQTIAFVQEKFINCALNVIDVLRWFANLFGHSCPRFVVLHWRVRLPGVVFLAAFFTFGGFTSS